METQTALITRFSLVSNTKIYTIKPLFRVSARSRKNHLRKKLIQQQPGTTIENPSTSNLGISTPNTVLFTDEISTIEPIPNQQVETVLAPSSSLLGFVIGKATRLSRVGVSVFCGLLLFIAFFRKEKGEEESSSRLEKEILRRKIRARMVKEKGKLEVIQDAKEPEMMFMPPRLDKEELMKVTSLDKIEEIRAMTRELRDQPQSDVSSGLSIQDAKEPEMMFMPPQLDKEELMKVMSLDKIQEIRAMTHELCDQPQSDVSCGLSIQDTGKSSADVEKVVDNKKSVGVKLKIISSVNEAREYLYNKEKKQGPEVSNSHKVPKNDDDDDDRTSSSNQSSNGDVFINNNDSEDEPSGGELGRANREKWITDNFHEFEPLVEKIRDGFRNNYNVAREKVKQDINLVSELQRDDDESDFEWMKDEKLREIVFQVRENELMGRDPFYLMDAQDKALFFKGLEDKVEKENEKLRHLHEYLHSNIENLDYGADGISLYDPPEKIIPRWKGPPPATTMSQEFLDDYLDQRKALFAETVGNMDLDSQNFLQKSNKTVVRENLKVSKTVIEGSDGSIKAGKKSGKEFWQHTKKWSRGFIDSYNAESDPETKAAMKDIGKDLDRWITEKEIQDAADIMDKVPDKGKKFITEKINKLKREMELFGPQAVVSKYSEYGDEEEIDYYWWLDLPHLLCIEIYIDGDGDERIGFYSLEMASDLELDPKPHHIIAFEDVGDCKNLCYIIQTHMEMLGNGNAFVVPQLPKDTYKEAKANGFNVTVIRKGELKMDVDQTLEEVEEKIVEIGSKMYHDKIMKSHNVDVDSVMKGVFGFTNRRRLKRPTK